MNTKLFVLIGLFASCMLGPLATTSLFANHDSWRGWSSCHDNHHWWDRDHHDRGHHDRDHHGGDHHGGGHHGGGHGHHH